MASDGASQLSAIPNVFYDLIVFLTPTATLVAGIVVGVGGIEQIPILDRLEVTALNAIALLGLLIVASYEFGRLAEAWSAAVVQTPLRWIARETGRLGRFSVFQDENFCANLKPQVSSLGLPGQSAAGDKWTLYFYAFLISPGIGSDLLKRYAWEKLARSSGFTLALLFATSVVVGLLSVCGLGPGASGPWTFGSLRLAAAYGALAALTYIEYYRRNCWNNDLLRKVLPVLKEAGRMSVERAGNQAQQLAIVVRAE